MVVVVVVAVVAVVVVDSAEHAAVWRLHLHPAVTHLRRCVCRCHLSVLRSIVVVVVDIAVGPPHPRRPMYVCIYACPACVHACVRAKRKQIPLPRQGHGAW